MIIIKNKNKKKKVGVDSAGRDGPYNLRGQKRQNNSNKNKTITVPLMQIKREVLILSELRKGPNIIKLLNTVRIVVVCSSLLL